MRAHEEFLDSLDRETSAGLVKTNAGEAYVAVYGKTQVGKTSLILELMGVAPEAQARVSNVLRGGRPRGKSATTMATAYRRSADRHWHVRVPGVVEASYADDLSMTQALSDIRARMSERNLSADDVCTISIPSDCYPEQAPTGPTVRMLDLPGTEARDAVERDYVREVARKCLPGADLILLLGRADDLGFLRPDALAIPGIEDWQLVPERFRIITTYSFTLGSLHDLASKHRDRLEPGIFRARLFAQLATHGIALSAEAAHPERFYPLEFGDSWRDGLRGTDAELLHSLTPMLAGLMQALRQDIATSADQYARLLNACSAHEVAVRVKRFKMKEFKGSISEACKELRSLRLQLRANQRRTEAERNARGVMQAQLEGLSERISDRTKQRFRDARTRALLEALSRRVSQGEQLDDYDQLAQSIRQKESVDAFMCLLSEFESAQTQHTTLPTPEVEDLKLPRFMRLAKNKGIILFATSDPIDLPADLKQAKLEPGRQTAELRERVRRKLGPIRRRLNEYWFDAYFPSPFSTLGEDTSQIARAMQDASRAAEDYLIEALEERIRATRKKLASDIKESDCKIASLQDQACGLESDLNAARERLQKICSHRAECWTRLEQDEQSRGKFAGMLERRYQQEFRDRCLAMQACKHPAMRLVELLACGQLIDERNKIMERVG